MLVKYVVELVPSGWICQVACLINRVWVLGDHTTEHKVPSSVNQIRLHMTAARSITGDITLVTDMGQVSTLHSYSVFLCIFSFFFRKGSLSPVTQGERN